MKARSIKFRIGIAIISYIAFVAFALGFDWLLGWYTGVSDIVRWLIAGIPVVIVLDRKSLREYKRRLATGA